MSAVIDFTKYLASKRRQELLDDIRSALGEAWELVPIEDMEDEPEDAA